MNHAHFIGIFFDINLPNYNNDGENLYLYFDYKGECIEDIYYKGECIEVITSYLLENNTYSTKYISIRLQKLTNTEAYDVFEYCITANTKDELKTFVTQFVREVLNYRYSLLSFKKTF